MVYGKIFFFIILTLIFVFVIWQMLCLFVSMADVIAWQMLHAILKLWQMLLPRGRCFALILWVADVIAILLWQMFIPQQYIATLVLANVIAKWQMEWPHIICCLLGGRCYCPVTGGIAMHLFYVLWWQMLLPSGRWNSHCGVWMFPSWYMLLSRGQMDVWVDLL